MAIKVAVLVEDKSFNLVKFCNTKNKRFKVLMHEDYLTEVRLLTTNLVLLLGPTSRILDLFDICSRLNEKEMRTLNTVYNFAIENKVDINKGLTDASKIAD